MAIKYKYKYKYKNYWTNKYKMKLYGIFVDFVEIIEYLNFIIEDFFIESKKILNEYGGIE